MALSKATVHATPGESSVTINGEDISSQLKSVRIDVGQVGQVPVLWLEAMTGDLHFDGEVEVRQVSLGTPASEFIAAIDPVLLDRAVNDLLQIQGGTYPELVLACLRSWAEGGG